MNIPPASKIWKKKKKREKNPVPGTFSHSCFLPLRDTGSRSDNTKYLNLYTDVQCVFSWQLVHIFAVHLSGLYGSYSMSVKYSVDVSLSDIDTCKSDVVSVHQIALHSARK